MPSFGRPEWSRHPIQVVAVRGDLDGGGDGFQDNDDEISPQSLYIAGRGGPMFADAVEGDGIVAKEEWGLGPAEDVAHPTTVASGPLRPENRRPRH